MNDNLNPKKLRDRMRRTIRDIRAGEPGKRFIRYWEIRQRREQEHTPRKILLLSLGFFLVVAGIILGPTPFAPGFVLGIPGLAILASRLRFVAKALDKGELLALRIAEPLKNGLHKNGGPKRPPS